MHIENFKEVPYFPNIIKTIRSRSVGVGGWQGMWHAWVRK
jgi:hypothetical protein